MKHNNQQQNLNNGIVGVWVKRYSFSVDFGRDSLVNAMEHFTFHSDGIAEYGYVDDSGINNGSPERYTYRIDGNRVVLTSDFGDDVNDFEIVNDRLIIIDNQLNYREEFIFEAVN